MTRTIRIDDDIYNYLKDRAEPFEDTPSTVLRRLLELPSENGAGATGAESFDSEEQENPASAIAAPTKPGKARRSKKRGRATRGSLVPQTDYELPILQVLDEKGGRAPSREVIDTIEPILADKLQDIDRSETSSGEIRWRNRAQFVRLTLIERGEMVKDSPRGIWEITDAGRERVRKA